MYIPVPSPHIPSQRSAPGSSRVDRPQWIRHAGSPALHALARPCTLDPCLAGPSLHLPPGELRDFAGLTSPGKSPPLLFGLDMLPRVPRLHLVAFDACATSLPHSYEYHGARDLRAPAMPASAGACDSSVKGWSGSRCGRRMSLVRVVFGCVKHK